MIKLVIFLTLVAFGAAFPTIFGEADGTAAAVTALAASPLAASSITAPLTTAPLATASISATPIIAGVKTILQPETIQIHEPTITKVGDIVQKIPTSVSHQSQTVVHEHADLRTPIVAPAVRTYTSHILKAYSTPLVYAAAAPVLKVLHN